MEINKTFVRTSKNYDINSFNIPDYTFNHKIKRFDGFSTNYTGEIYKCSSLPLSPICEESKRELEISNKSLEINVNKNLDQSIFLNFDFDKCNMLAGKIKFNIKENISANVVINFNSNKKAYNNSFISFDCENNSYVNCVVVSDLSYESENFLNIENELKNNSTLKFTIIDFAGKISVTRFLSNIEGERANSILKTMYIGENEGKIDLNYAQNIYGKNATATIKTIGALQGKSSKNFKGLIDFKNGAVKSRGSEEELCLLLSKNAKSKALPLLCCSEEDVDGSHSSATGKIGDKELFYIMSRGISKTEALRLLLKAKLTKVLDDVFDEKIKQQINEKIDRKILDENDKL